MYVDPDYKTKKDFIAAVKAGKRHKPYNPSGFYFVPQNGSYTGIVEGPHYPRPHKWYSRVVIKDGIVTAAK